MDFVLKENAPTHSQLKVLFKDIVKNFPNHAIFKKDYTSIKTELSKALENSNGLSDREYYVSEDITYVLHTERENTNIQASKIENALKKGILDDEIEDAVLGKLRVSTANTLAARLNELINETNYNYFHCPDSIQEDDSICEHYLSFVIRACIYRLGADLRLLRGTAASAEQYAAAAYQHYLEAQENAESCYDKEKRAQQRRAVAQAGGREKAKKYIEPLKKELMRLLREKQPEGGWPTLTAAVTALEPDIKALREEIGPDKSSITLDRRLLEWLREPEIRAVFTETAKKKYPYA